MTLDPRPAEALAERTDWLRFAGLHIGLRPTLQTVVRASFAVIPRQVASIFTGVGLDDRHLDVAVHDVPLPIPIGARSTVSIAVGHGPAAEPVEYEPTFDRPVGTFERPVVALTSEQLFAETPIVISQVTGEAGAEGGFDISPGSCVQIDLGHFDLAAGVDLDLPDGFSVDSVAVVWTSVVAAGRDESRALVGRLIDTIEAADARSTRLPARRWANDLREDVVLPMIGDLESEIALLSSRLVRQDHDVGEAIEGLQALLRRLQRVSKALVRASESEQHAHVKLRDAATRLRDELDGARTSFPFVRQLEVDHARPHSHRLPRGAVPPGTYEAVIIPYSYRPASVELVSVIGSLMIVAATMMLLAWRLAGSPWDVDWAAVAGHIDRSGGEIVTLLVFLPTILFVLIPGTLVKVAPAEQRANTLFLAILSLGALAGPVLAVMAIGEPAPRAFVTGLVAAAALQCALVVGAWRKLLAPAATARSRQARLHRELLRL